MLGNGSSFKRTVNGENYGVGLNANCKPRILYKSSPENSYSRDHSPLVVLMSLYTSRYESLLSHFTVGTRRCFPTESCLGLLQFRMADTTIPILHIRGEAMFYLYVKRPEC